MSFPSPAEASYVSVDGRVVFAVLYLLGIVLFAWIVAKRMTPLLHAKCDPRFDRPWERLRMLVKYWFGQWKHPRYRSAGIIHILIFVGFLILIVHALAFLLIGVFPGFQVPGGPAYATVTDYAATVVFVAVLIAAIRRSVFRPARYSVPARFGKPRGPDAIFLLGLIAIVMLAAAICNGARVAGHAGEAPLFSLAWVCSGVLAGSSMAVLRNVYLGAYLLHAVTFFFLLCYRPFGIQFHVESSLFSIYFAKLDPGKLKPVRWDVPDGELEQAKLFGVKTFQDFTWKHILDFYSCADCGRCSDQCPSHAAGRPLSPRFFTTKARDYCFTHYPVFGSAGNGARLVGTIFSEDEIWSCTTCGACEAECPMLVEYIDKIVDLRRGLVDDGNVPQSLQKPFKAIESRGNPYGKVQKKRADWANGSVAILGGNGPRDTLYFVDSITSYDERMQSVARATARILEAAGIDFGILGAAERDSGHDVRRFGEEMLFFDLRQQNSDAIRASGVRRIVTADPHAYNALKHDYTGIPPVEHISEVIARQHAAGKIRFRGLPGDGAVYTYHDPCYLGRHNGVFEEPRKVLDAIPGMCRVEMERCRDRSFCCGGGGLALFYEPREEERIGVKRVRMAADAGADTIVTACPFCMTNIEDAIKVAGLEGRMTAIDLTELVERQMERGQA
jgi:Fe-S oxidoreductase